MRILHLFSFLKNKVGSMNNTRATLDSRSRAQQNADSEKKHRADRTKAYQRSMDNQIRTVSVSVGKYLSDSHLENNWYLIVDLLKQRNSFVMYANRDLQSIGYEMTKAHLWQDVKRLCQSNNAQLEEFQGSTLWDRTASMNQHNHIQGDLIRIIGTSSLIYHDLELIVPKMRERVRHLHKSIYYDLVEVGDCEQEIKYQYRLAHRKYNRVASELHDVPNHEPNRNIARNIRMRG